MANEPDQKTGQDIPLLSIIIPTHNRPHMVMNAVHSALAQTIENIEVIVVDDGSQPAIELPRLARLHLLRLEPNQGGAAARNAGVAKARADYVCFLDDDDTLLPHMAEVSLQAMHHSGHLPQPVAVLSGMEIVDEEGTILERHLPPTLLKGAHYSLEDIEEGKSIYCKSTAVIPRKAYLEMGGFDPEFRSRVHSELFFRLNAACSLLGIDTVTYRWLQHNGPRVTQDSRQRELGFKKLINKHKALFKQHPQKFSWYYRDHVMRTWRAGNRTDAIMSFLKSVRWQIQAWISGRK
jgi:glycosyltransferase involved in cell wall biosynthesis